MLIKQEIQAIQDPDYKFTVEHTPTGWLVICYKKDEMTGFFKCIGKVMNISRNSTGFKSLKKFKGISKEVKIKLLQIACNYMDEGVSACFLHTKSKKIGPAKVTRIQKIIIVNIVIQKSKIVKGR